MLRDGPSKLHRLPRLSAGRIALQPAANITALTAKTDRAACTQAEAASVLLASLHRRSALCGTASVACRTCCSTAPARRIGSRACARGGLLCNPLPTALTAQPDRAAYTQAEAA